ncbi:isatin hydrolase-like [Amphibalanus amphitrite]|uniref:isatin hydrolase-like n=1 Tax=Amphibalanus amphitrite TaxID=1232801 RepID=UPI001C902A94|nr:isatin hydrolase-like [Amphibalanus amphitrite]
MAPRMPGVARWALALALLVYCSPAVAGELLDLTHTLDNTTLYWNEKDSFTLTRVEQPANRPFWSQKFKIETVEHAGTHMDAPSHFYEQGWTIADIPVERLIANAAVIDISERSAANPDAMVTPEDLDAWRDAHGQFKYPTIVLIRTGYAAYWPDRNRYFGLSDAEPGVYHFPGFGEAAGQDLAEDPAVVGVGIDTASLDQGVSRTLPVHAVLSRANRFGMENVGDLSRVPASGARIYALPMKTGGGSGGPCRVVIELEPSTCRGKGRGQKGRGRGQKGRGRGQGGRRGQGRDQGQEGGRRQGQDQGQEGRRQRQGRRQGRRRQQEQHAHEELPVPGFE